MADDKNISEGYCVELIDESEMVEFGHRLSRHLTFGMIVTLNGDLGAGKTTLSRGLLQALGHEGPVKSPTYTLVEPYDLPFGRVNHFDLYRVNDPQELEYIGFSDYLDSSALSLIEWPERGGEYLHTVDLALDIEHLKEGRKVVLSYQTVKGEIV
ncbi:MAG: tRNA (adenosine(37)-N6)-threonylcarbamoyltransferase complex ATPase subunit type 1 TsaE, partial [Porticoccaceae bacterium]|nr:tRNA (adenosine(37)-N6)-threonylcarbamoyltransferase complex ATPase subunit type 1 TsaE [Porticoccaceae bacterium]